ncbi:MAG: Gfo/Idh/MocA family oxidoreductase [Armatimonadota bacterium]|nr:MAG: Gfo/Idh/MocA family oxidoreductase [Armatimonadota bacterium]
MRIDFHGRLSDADEIRAGFIGCGSHSFRNIYPTFQFAPVHLAATCDLDLEKARAFAAKFGARSAYSDYREMLEREELDAVFIVVGYDDAGRPLYPRIATDCLSAGRHVWIEKPPAATCAEIETMSEAAAAAGKHVMVGLKKMFAPANEHAKALSEGADFGRVSLVTLQYPQAIPTPEEFARYLRGGERVAAVVGFLDHLCHPASLLVYLLGMPETLYYECSAARAGVVTFSFASGVVASLASTHGAAVSGGMERTTVVSDAGRHIVVDNNIRVTYHRNPVSGYGDVPTFFAGAPERTSAVWEPEFSLGQLYSKGLFLQGYYGEVTEFARAIIENRAPEKATLEHARQVTRIFEAFAEGPRRTVSLTSG